MVKTTTIELISKKEFELIRITKDILKAVEESGVQNGVVYAITAHTTTGILVNESLACLEVDIERKNSRSWSPPSTRTITTTFCPPTAPSAATRRAI